LANSWRCSNRQGGGKSIKDVGGGHTKYPQPPWVSIVSSCGIVSNNQLSLPYFNLFRSVFLTQQICFINQTHYFSLTTNMPDLNQTHYFSLTTNMPDLQNILKFAPSVWFSHDMFSLK
jgi:hypothetical protein